MKRNQTDSKYSFLFPVGLGIGVAIGALIHNIGVGLALGAAIGTIARLTAYLLGVDQVGENTMHGE